MAGSGESVPTPPGCDAENTAGSRFNRKDRTIPSHRLTKIDLADILEESLQSTVIGQLTLTQAVEVTHAVADALRGNSTELHLLARKHGSLIGIPPNGRSCCDP